MPEEATSEYVNRVKEAYPTMNGFRRVEAEGGADCHRLSGVTTSY